MRPIACVLFSVATACGLRALDLPSVPFLYVEGSASRETPPTLARVSFSVRERGATYQDAFTSGSAKSLKVVGLLTELGTKRDDITSYSIEVRETSGRESDQTLDEVADESTRQTGTDSTAREARPRPRRAFCAERRFEVTLRDLGRFRDLIQGIHGLEVGSYLEVSFDTVDRAKIEQELLQAAIRNSRERAERLAQGYGVKLDGVLGISEIPMADISGRLVPDTRDGGEGPSAMRQVEIFVPATVEVRAAVHALFRVQN